MLNILREQYNDREHTETYANMSVIVDCLGEMQKEYIKIHEKTDKLP